ncbi:MAG: N-acetylmuramate alpha-1-phosphate uridylyltransferase MurU [Pseudohongiellaceae bacterium]
MQALILAAGLGKRMRPLTDDLPKPLLQVGGKALIEHQIERLVAAGVSDIVINLFHLGHKIQQALGDGSRYGAHIRYSQEDIPMETAGGIIKAMPLLASDCFIVANADVWTDFDYARLKAITNKDCLGHLVLVRDAEHNPQGDFYLDSNGRVHTAPPSSPSSTPETKNQQDPQHQRLTFTGISVLHKNLFHGLPVRPCPVVPLLQEAMQRSLITGELHTGRWMDIGTPERLKKANAML